MARTKYRFNKQTLTYEKVGVNTNWTKLGLGIVIGAATGYFIIGAILVLLSLYDFNTYLGVAGIVGGISSVAGLLSFIFNKISRYDIENVGMEYFKKMVDSAEKVKEAEEILKAKDEQLTAKERELKKLRIQQAELQFAVEKASMIIFLTDQLQRVEHRIVEIIENHKELSSTFEQRQGIKKQLIELKQEIESTEQTKVVEDVISMVRSHNSKRESGNLIHRSSLQKILSDMVRTGLWPFT